MTSTIAGEAIGIEQRRFLLSGWGRVGGAVCRVARPTTAEDAVRLIAAAPARGVLPRGLGRSYGDVAQNGGGLVLDLTGLNAVSELDLGRGTVVVQAGCSLAALIDLVLPHGWFLPVAPGTRHVTVGGAIACDVHGKNHHRDGSFGRYVRAVTLATSEGDVRRLDRATGAQELGATVGGLGLTGVILDAELELARVETAVMRVDVERTAGFEETLARLAETDHRYRYSVAWVDCRASGRRLGRGVLMGADHAVLDELDPAVRPVALSTPRRRRLGVPQWASAGPLLRGHAGDIFNDLTFHRARRRRGMHQSLDAFFFPLDRLASWNQLYGRAGFVQYQLVVPGKADRELTEILRLVSQLEPAPTLAVLKRLGPGSGLLSFPLPGWTLALDLPLPSAGLAATLDRADALVASAGGRVYLAKDVRLGAELVPVMYPEIGRWRDVQRRLDPAGRMRGDLERRLDLCGRRPG